MLEAPTHYCDQCGRRYNAPGQCSFQHPPCELVEIPDDASAAVVELTPVITPDEPSPVELALHTLDQAADVIAEARAIIRDLKDAAA